MCSPVLGAGRVGCEPEQLPHIRALRRGCAQCRAGGMAPPGRACTQRPGYVTCRTLNLLFSFHFTNASAGSKRLNWRSLAFAACVGFSISFFLSKIFTGMACSHCCQQSIITNIPCNLPFLSSHNHIPLDQIQLKKYCLFFL